MSELDKGVAKLEEVISMIQNHYEETKGYTRLTMQKFTYEDKEFSSCLVCGHSDKAIIYELEKALKLLKATPNKDKDK